MFHCDIIVRVSFMEYGFGNLIEIHDLCAEAPLEFEDDTEPIWLEQGLKLQSKLLQERPFDKNIFIDSEEERTSLYPELGLVDRARDCVEHFGKCSVVELERLCSGKYRPAFISFRVLTMIEAHY